MKAVRTSTLSSDRLIQLKINEIDDLLQQIDEIKSNLQDFGMNELAEFLHILRGQIYCERQNLMHQCVANGG